MLIISLLGTLAAIGCTSYAVYITSQVSGEKLLTLNSELGYRYATTYRDWQSYAAISVIAAVVLWIIFIFIPSFEVRIQQVHQLGQFMG